MQQFRKRKKLPPAPSPEVLCNSYIFNLIKIIFTKTKSFLTLSHFIDIFVSLFGTGKLPVFPGTWGSLATIGCCFLLCPFLSIKSFILTIVGLFIVGTLLLTILFYKEPNTNTDPSYVVIDEAVGQMIALLPVLGTVYYWPLAFVFFRFFDIKKPLLVSWPELNLHGTPISSSLSIMLDDVLAGIYSAGVTYTLVLIIEAL